MTGVFSGRRPSGSAFALPDFFARKSLKLRPALLGIALMPAVFSGSAEAQSATGGQSGTVENEVRRPSEPRSKVAPFQIEKPSSAGDATSSQRFLVRDIVVEGAKSLPLPRIRAALTPFIGRELTLAELFRAADAVTSVYAGAGYPLSFAIIPEQDVADGIVHIKVVEGTIDKVEVEVTGDSLIERDRIKEAVERQFAKLVRSGPVRTADLDRALLLIRDWPGVQISSVLRPSATVEGAADMLVQVKLDPLEGRIGLDNRLRKDFGTYRAGAGGSLRSLLLPGDELSVDVRASITHDAFRQFYGRYETPFGAAGLRMFGSWSLAKTRAAKGLLGFLDFNGKESVGRVGGSYPLLRSRARNLTVSLEGAATDSRSGILDVTLIHDKLRTVEGRVTYDWASSNGAQTLVEGGMIQGLSVLGASKRNSPLASRSYGTPVFTALTARAFYDTPLGTDFNMTFDVDGQATVYGSALAPVECAYGGERFGRAYGPGAIGGDHCLRAAIEFKHQARVNDIFLEPFLFGDFGAVWQKGRLQTDEQRSATASSLGIGLRTALPHGLVAEGVAAIPLNKRYADSPADARFFFNLNLFL